jgi:hypothetical protein
MDCIDETRTMDLIKIMSALHIGAQFIAGPAAIDPSMASVLQHLLYWILLLMILERCIALRGDANIFLLGFGCPHHPGSFTAHTYALTLHVKVCSGFHTLVKLIL